MRLIQALRGDRSDCRVFAVGDDWQAIYRFAGSDVDYFTRIENYLGPTARVILPDTFRLVSDVASLSSRFVLENPQQLEKELAPRTHGHQGPAVLIHLHAQHGEGGLIQEILDEIAERTPGGRVLVLARYRFRLDVIQEVRLPRDLQIEATTAHRSKGLEADEVLVLGVDAGTFGFPTEIQDDEVLRLLLEGEEEHPNAEERRLFYVALTRTRSRVPCSPTARTHRGLSKSSLVGATGTG